MAEPLKKRYRGAGSEEARRTLKAAYIDCANRTMEHAKWMRSIGAHDVCLILEDRASKLFLWASEIPHG